MRKLFLISTAIAVSAMTMSAQTTQLTVVNAASNALPGTPNSSIAQGSMFIVYGANLGPATISQAGGYPLPTNLSGTTVTVRVGTTDVNAFVAYTLATQVAAVLPSNTPLGTGTVTVRYNNGTPQTGPITVVKSSFGIFSINQQGSGPAVVQNFISNAETPVNTLVAPARSGQAVIIWGTGLGPVTFSDAGQPEIRDLGMGAEVYIGGKRADVFYQGRSLFAGVDQINAFIPAGVEGCYVPVAVRVNNVVSNYTTVAVAPPGAQSCSDPNGLSGEELRLAELNGTFRIGTIGLSRTVTKASAGGFSLDYKADSGYADFERFTFNGLISRQGQAAGVNAIGSCYVVTYRGSTTEIPETIPSVALDAGPFISVEGPRGTKRLERPAGQTSYSGELGGGISFPGAPAPLPDYLEPGSYRVVGTGGSGANAVGPFTINVTLPAAMQWTNIDAVNTITRSAGQEITWTGGDPNGYVNIFGGASSGTGNNAVTVGFICTERTSVGRFTIPSLVLQSLPTSNEGVMFVSGISANTKFTASGLDSGNFIVTSTYLKTPVRFQ